VILLSASVWPELLCGHGTDLGAIRGTVRDQSRARVPSVHIEVKDLVSGAVRTLSSEANGDYQASDLRPGSYSVRASLNGFKDYLVSPVPLHNAETVHVDLLLSVAGPNEAVTVTSRPPTIDTESPVVSSSFNNRELTELPRDSRDIFSFLYLSPNITQAHQMPSNS
jgi:hypothetical protein